MEFCYTAIVLKKREVGETDRLYTLYTREGGKVTAIGRGVRKPKAKLAGHLETLNRGSVVINRSRGLGNITGAVAEWYGIGIRREAFALGEAVETLRRFDRIIGLAERDEWLFDLLREYLESVDGQVGKLDHPSVVLVSQAFLFRALGHLGYQFNATHSVATGESLRAGLRYGFSVAEGGMAEWDRIADRDRVVAVSENAIKLLRLYSTQRIGALARVRLSPSVIRETGTVLEALLRWIE